MFRHVYRHQIIVASCLTVAGALAGCRSKAPAEPTPQVAHPVGEIFATSNVGARPYGVAISASGAIYVARLDAATLSRGQLPASLLTTGAAVGSIPSHVVFNPAGTRAYVSNQGSANVSVVDVATDRQTALIPLPTDAWNVLVSPDGARLYATTNQGVLAIINTSTNAIITSLTLQQGDALRGIALDAPRNNLYVAGRNSGTIYVVDTRSNTLVRSIPVGGTPQRMAVSPNGAELYVANEARGLDIITLGTGAVRTIALGGGGYGLALTADAAQLYVTVPSAGLVRIIARETGAIVNTLAIGGTPRNVAFSSSGQHAVISAETAGTVTFVR